ncbi:MAG: CDP-alcohol phosphatidyltransferase family protein [Lentimicrobiaceae bacterium]|nr:CDP-alcohol phosphatidyltransferase family protein [Lentimicrobiaceae bacterium]
MTLRKHIPNAITAMNLLCGCIAVFFAFINPQISALFIVLAAIFDFFDGMVARLLHVKSAIGKELDSLADIVSFGVAPGFILFGLIDQSQELQFFIPFENIAPFIHQLNILPFVAFAIPVFSGLRLAKFNVDTRQEEAFIGLPTPACALMILSLPMMERYTPEIFYAFFSNTYVLLVLTVIFSFLLVAPLRLFSLKFKGFGWKNNEIRWAFLLVSLLLIIVLQFLAIPVILLVYIILSIIFPKS